MDKIIKLSDRAIVEISGDDRKQFLQGLITNDINKLSRKLLYCAMLSAKGRFLYDFFIFENGEKILLDCLAARADEIVKKFNFYKLKSQISVRKIDEMAVFVDLEGNFSNEGVIDPRNSAMGKRIYSSLAIPTQNNDLQYHFKRISLKIPEGEYDLTYDKSIINEFNFDNLNAIDYEKGCYIGQELTARTHHLGQVRKKIFYVKIEDTQKIEKNCEITCEGKNVRIILSSVFY